MKYSFRSMKTTKKKKRKNTCEHTFFRGTSDRKIRLHHTANVPFIYSSMTLARHKECIFVPLYFIILFESDERTHGKSNAVPFSPPPPPAPPPTLTRANNTKRIFQKRGWRFPPERPEFYRTIRLLSSTKSQRSQLQLSVILCSFIRSSLFARVFIALRPLSSRPWSGIQTLGIICIVGRGTQKPRNRRGYQNILSFPLRPSINSLLRRPFRSANLEPPPPPVASLDRWIATRR